MLSKFFVFSGLHDSQNSEFRIVRGNFLYSVLLFFVEKLGTSSDMELGIHPNDLKKPQELKSGLYLRIQRLFQCYFARCIEKSSIIKNLYLFRTELQFNITQWLKKCE